MTNTYYEPTYNKCESCASLEAHLYKGWVFLCQKCIDERENE